MILSREMEAALRAALQGGTDAIRGLLRHVPDALLFSEVGRRNNRKIVNRSGGVVWSKHRPDYSRCRCRACNAKRRQSAAQ